MAGTDGQTDIRRLKLELGRGSASQPACLPARNEGRDDLLSLGRNLRACLDLLSRHADLDSKLSCEENPKGDIHEDIKNETILKGRRGHIVKYKNQGAE